MGVKLVMEEKDGPKVVIGISNDNCDPIIETVDGYIEDAMGRAYRILHKAENQWNTAPRYPKYEKPKKETKPEKTETGKLAKQSTGKGKKSTKSGENIPKNIPDETKEVKAETKVDESQRKSTKVDEKLAESVTPQLPLLAGKSEPERKCRVCGCTQDNACEGGCSWVEKDLCSACAEKDKKKPGLYLQDGRGPFESVQEALEAYGALKDARPKHNRYDRLSRAWKQVIIRKV